jgi:hypothetical protein
LTRTAARRLVGDHPQMLRPAQHHEVHVFLPGTDHCHDGLVRQHLRGRLVIGVEGELAAQPERWARDAEHVFVNCHILEVARHGTDVAASRCRKKTMIQQVLGDMPRRRSRLRCFRAGAVTAAGRGVWLVRNSPSMLEIIFI